MKKIISLSLVLLLVFTSLTLFSSCGKEKEYPVTVGDVTINEEPLNTVVLSKNITDIISCIGYDVKMVGRSDEVNQEGLEIVPSVGSCDALDVNKIEELEADIILCDTNTYEVAKKAVENIDINVVSFESAKTKKELKTLYENIGKVLGGNITGLATANEAFTELTDTLDGIEQEATVENPIKKTFCYLYLDSNGVLKTMNKGTWGAVLFKYSGAMNVLENAESEEVDKDTLLISNPDVIFCNSQETIDYLNQDLTLWELDALQGNTSIVPVDDLRLQGYTSLTALENMISIIYPEEIEE